MSDPGAFYEPLGDGRFMPTRATESPWDTSAQHGGPPAALLAQLIDQTVDDGLRLARLSIDFLGAIPRTELTVPLARALIVADSANGISSRLPLDDWWSIPPAMTTTLLRLPQTEWVHLAAHTRLTDDGLGLAHGDLHDEHGFLGEVAQPLLVARR